MALSERPRVVCVGSNLESRVALEGLLAGGVHVVGLVTLPPGDRRGVSDYVDLHPLCAEHGVETVDCRDINAQPVLERIRQLRPDHLFTLGWSRLFGPELLAIPTGLTVGSHPTLLPEGRGRAPIPWTILLDVRHSASSLFRMSEGADEGALLAQEPFDVPAGAYAMEVYLRSAHAMRDAFLRLHDDLVAGTVRELPQEGEPSHRARRGPADGHLDLRAAPAAWIERLVRAVSEPYPGAYVYWRDERIRVWRASLDDVPRWVGAPGQILCREGERLLVQAADRPLWLWKLTADGAPVDPARLDVGRKLGYAVEDALHALRLRVARLEDARTEEP